MSFTNIWGLWPDRCWNKHVSVRNVRLLGGGPTGLGLEVLVAGCHNGGLVWLLWRGEDQLRPKHVVGRLLYLQI